VTDSGGEISKKQSGVGTTTELLGEAAVVAGWPRGEDEGMGACTPVAPKLNTFN
jgi:hypothetical protein